jgi:hypothetical protein
MPPERLCRLAAAKFVAKASLPRKTESEGPQSGGNSRGIRRSRDYKENAYISMT